jgi:hypothetical protein
MHPSPGDIATNNIPDHVLTLGAQAADILAGRGFPADRLAVVGGLRFEKFLDQARAFGNPPEGAARIALCCVGVDLDEGVELVHKAAQAVAGEHGLSLVVNFHPMSGPQFRAELKSMLRARSTPGFDAIRFDDRSVRELLSDVHTVLYIDSNAALEAAGAGRQVIYVARETGLDYDKLPPGVALHCRTPEEIRHALLTGTARPAVEMRDLLKRCIAPVDDLALVSFIGGAGVRGSRAAAPQSAQM